MRAISKMEWPLKSYCVQCRGREKAGTTIGLVLITNGSVRPSLSTADDADDADDKVGSFRPLLFSPSRPTQLQRSLFLRLSSRSPNLFLSRSRLCRYAVYTMVTIVRTVTHAYTRFYTRKNSCLLIDEHHPRIHHVVHTIFTTNDKDLFIFSTRKKVIK